MAISNTSILIKRSNSTATPTSLQAGEFAYSYVSNTLFFGTSDGNGVVNVGGQYYTQTLDDATNANTASTLVKRDESGSFYGRLFGNANTASTLITARDFDISGGDITASAQSFDGSSSITLNASLNEVPDLVAGYYGGSTPSSSTIPVVQVAANGRIMSIANTTVTSSFNISDGSTSSQIESGNTFYHLGTEGIVTEVSENTVTFSTDDTVVRSNTFSVGPQVIETMLSVFNDLNVTGNLSVLGNTTTIHVNDYIVDDPMIYLAGNNYSSDIVNIGFAANYYGDGDERHTGLFRAADSKQYYLFDNYIPELSGNNQIDRSNSSFHIATITANIADANIVSSEIYSSVFKNGTIFDLNSAIAVTDGGTGQTSFNNGEMIVGSGTGALQTLANTNTEGTYGSSSYIPVLTTDVYGRVSSVSNTAVAIDASQVVDGILPIARGGTNNNSFTTNTLTMFDGFGIVSLANVSFTVNGTSASNNTITSVTVDNYGRASEVTYSQISGLTVPQGGTGFSSATLNGIIYGNMSDTLQVTSAAGDSDQTWSNQIMTVNNYGVPTWTTSLDGGMF